MGKFVEEGLRRLPELKARMHEGDEELPYVVARHILNLLVEMPSGSIRGEVVARVVKFDRWCMAQPRGESAEDDIFSIWAVGFREDLFGHDRLLPIIPRIMTREDVVRNEAYLKQWVGEERYVLALRQFGQGTWATGGKRGRHGGGERQN